MSLLNGYVAICIIIISITYIWHITYHNYITGAWLTGMTPPQEFLSLQPVCEVGLRLREKQRANYLPLLQLPNGCVRCIFFPESCTFTVTKQRLPLHSRPTRTPHSGLRACCYSCQICAHPRFERRAENDSFALSLFCMCVFFLPLCSKSMSFYTALL